MTAVECISLSCIICKSGKGSAPRAADAARYVRAKEEYNSMQRRQKKEVHDVVHLAI